MREYLVSGNDLYHTTKVKADKYTVTDFGHLIFQVEDGGFMDHGLYPGQIVAVKYKTVGTFAQGRWSSVLEVREFVDGKEATKL